MKVPKDCNDSLDALSGWFVQNNVTDPESWTLEVYANKNCTKCNLFAEDTYEHWSKECKSCVDYCWKHIKNGQVVIYVSPWVYPVIDVDEISIQLVKGTEEEAKSFKSNCLKEIHFEGWKRREEGKEKRRRRRRKRRRKTMTTTKEILTFYFNYAEKRKMVHCI